MTIQTGQPLWVCGSTGPREEEMILDAYVLLLRQFPQLQLAIVPRKPERFDEVANLIVAHGFACLRRSGAAPRVPPDVERPIAVFLGDTLGELRKFYALASVVFVGRTLVPMGGSDVMEVAGLGKPIIIGRYVENFAETVELLGAAGACETVHEARELPQALARVLADEVRRERMGRGTGCRHLSRARQARLLIEFERAELGSWERACHEEGAATLLNATAWPRPFTTLRRQWQRSRQKLSMKSIDEIPSESCVRISALSTFARNSRLRSCM